MILPALSGSSEALADIDLQAQYRNLLFVSQRNGELFPGDTNLLRVEVESRGKDDRLRVRGALEVQQTFASSDSLALASALTGPEGIPSSRLQVDLFRAFLQVKLPDPKLELTVGRQRLGWGVGQVLRPTNPFEPPDLLDPTREQRGTNALRLMKPVSGSVFVEGVAALTPNGDVQAGAQVSVRRSKGLDVAFSVVHDGARNRELAGGSLQWNGATKAWLEASYRYQSGSVTQRYQEADHSMLLETGVSRQLSVGRGLTVSGEYLYLSNGDTYGGGPYMADALQDGRLLQGRHYLWGQGLLEVQAHLHVQLAALVNVADGSVYLQPQLISRPIDTLEVAVGAQIFAGESVDEFGRDDLPENGTGAVLYSAQTTWYF